MSLEAVINVHVFWGDRAAKGVHLVIAKGDISVMLCGGEKTAQDLCVGGGKETLMPSPVLQFLSCG